ncbi:protein of unknown function [Taphrina deformans PYCC 5710]|uniref:Uncharacterized protein n=1 Tax=Taphrina deformans (strain PYCC 5710 / ATCC 11124 / CBS 356.35 / IMI 108563 / JCM 9778 / NBRC 8474) TaxID=1097556 RepID=R4X9T4_TAPDE|nr:protein of unknown function [Taphrina deformans PYCC 5710]|eukprot:CCG80999.1 protein of unknown function [Taphrina deformans PYCC 5710]
MGLFTRSRKPEAIQKEKKAEGLCTKAYPTRQQAPAQHAPTRSEAVNEGASKVRTSGFVQNDHAPVSRANTALITFGQHGNIVTFDAFSSALPNTMPQKELAVPTVKVPAHNIARDSLGATSSFSLSTDGVGVLSCDTMDSETEANSEADTIKAPATRNKDLCQNNIYQNIAAESAGSRITPAAHRSTIDSIPRPIGFEKSADSFEQVANTAIHASTARNLAESCEHEQIAKELDTRIAKEGQPVPASKVPDFLKSKSISANYRRLRIPTDSSDSASTVIHRPPLSVRQRGTSTESVKKESILSVRLQELQAQYTRLNLDYHKLTSEQLETREILIDVRSELCTTNLTTTQNSVEIADLQDSRRSLAEELSTLKTTVRQCQEDLLAFRRFEQAEDSEKTHMATKTTIDVSKKAMPRRMNLREYKEFCAQQYKSSQAVALAAQPPSAIKFHDESATSYSDSSDDDCDLLVETGTAKPIEVPAKRPKFIEAQSIVANPRSKQEHHSMTASIQPSISQTTQQPRPVICEKSKAKSKMPNDVLRSIARDKLSSIAHFRKHRENQL